VTVSYEVQRMWQQAAVTYFAVLSRNLPGGAEENCEETLFKTVKCPLPPTRSERLPPEEVTFVM
jgi:hypothetical protein